MNPSRIPTKFLKPIVSFRRNIGRLEELVESIKKDGVLEPLIVSKSNGEHYRIICGYRRFLAACEAGLEEVPVIIVDELDIPEALELIWRENELRKDLEPDERALMVAVLVNYHGVRETSRRLSMSLSTVETLYKAGMVFKGVWERVRTSNTSQHAEFKPKVKLAEKVYETVKRAGYSGDSFFEIAGKVYLALSDLPTRIALHILSAWVNEPTLEKLDTLIKEKSVNHRISGLRRFSIPEIEERVPIQLEDGRVFEELLLKAGFNQNISYKIVSESRVKIADLEGEYSGISGIVCPRCNRIIRCRVCGSIIVDLCGFPHASLRDRKYHYVKQVTGR